MRISNPMVIANSLDIAAMRAADLEEVYRIEVASHEFPWSTGQILDSIEWHHCIVARERDVLVGYGILYSAGDEAHVLNLTVAPEYRRQGIGRALMVHLDVHARKLKASAMLLEVRPSNLPALALYRSFGFIKIGVRRNYYLARQGREHALVMRRSLS